MAWTIFGGCVAVLLMEAGSVVRAFGDHPVWTGRLPEQESFASNQNSSADVAKNESALRPGGE